MSRLRQTAVYMRSYCDEIQEVVLVVGALEAEPALASHNSVPF
jgi:hypothetical protein